MEYVITASGPFAEIEEQVIRALEQQGFVVQRTFSLHSASGGGSSPAEGKPGYSVLMLYAPDASCPPLGLLTLYEREGQTVVQTAPAAPPTGQSPPPGDAEAELVAALMMGGLELCGCHGGQCRPARLKED